MTPTSDADVGPLYPSLYQVNARCRVTALSRELGRRATLDDLPDGELDAWAALGFDWIWLLGVWRTGAAGRQISRSHAPWQEEFARVLPDLQPADICGSCFAIASYEVRDDLGGEAALARLRERLAQRGLRLMLDFVPNHMAPDHPWVTEHPAFVVQGTEADLARQPENYLRVGDRVIAHGRDPNFPGWPDTVQLDYGNPDLHGAMRGELSRIAAACDGVRCDMAMLLEPEVYERTWGLRPAPFWEAAIGEVRETHPDFVFMAEVYWDMEWQLQRRGFDYAYDKRLYDRLRDGEARPVDAHLTAELGYQRKLARFLENHDEPRAAVTFAPDQHRAAAVVTFLTPGMRFFHQGQLDGWRTRIPTHLCRGPDEPRDEVTRAFYEQLLACLRRAALREGQWQLRPCHPAGDDNPSHEAILAWTWTTPDERLLIVVNYAVHRSQCFVRPFDDLGDARWRLDDQLSEARYERDGTELSSRGLYLDLEPWGHHAFVLSRLPHGSRS